MKLVARRERPMRRHLVSASAAASLLTIVWTESALALSKCPGFFCKGGETAVPEFDGSAAVAVVSLLMGVCGLLYSRNRS
jgi:hypothetical protein